MAAKPVDPKNFYGSVLDHDNVKADMATVKVEHDFASGAKLVNTTRYGKTKQDYLLTSFMATNANLNANVASTDPDNWTMARTNLTTKDQLNEILTNQTTLTADFTTGAFKHTVVSGLELTNEKQTNYTYANRASGHHRPASDQHLPPEPEHADQRGPGQPAAQRRRSEAPPTPRACMCLTPSSSASSGSSTAACASTITTPATTPSPCRPSPRRKPSRSAPWWAATLRLRIT
jgi:outer membrane receptor for monomeric catechols